MMGLPPLKTVLLFTMVRDMFWNAVGITIVTNVPRKRLLWTRNNTMSILFLLCCFIVCDNGCLVNGCLVSLRWPLVEIEG